MKVILNQEVRGVGAPGDIVDVSDGYGRNYLLPRNLARLATPGTIRQAEGIRARRAEREIADLEQARSIAGHLEAEPETVDELSRVLFLADNVIRHKVIRPQAA